MVGKHKSISCLSMRHLVSFLFCATIAISACLGQNITTIKVDSSKYWSESPTLIELKSFEIQNKSDDTLVLWIDSVHTESADIPQSVIHYFMRNKFGDFGYFMNLFFEANINWSTYHPVVYFTFFTIIPPKKTFRVLVEGKTEFDPNWIVCCSKRTLKNILPWLPLDYNFHQLCYKSDVIVIR